MRLEYLPFFCNASFTSNRSAKSLPASIRAAMSPRESLTTNVLPSRILTRSSATSGLPPREEALEEHQQLEVALGVQLAAKHRRERVLLAGHERIEDALGGGDDAVGFVRLLGDREVTLSDRDQPRVGTPAAREVEADGPADTLEILVVAA